MDFWSQAMRVDELLSTTYTQCNLGNKYLPSCILFYDTTLCRFSHGMNFFICNCCGFCNLLIKSSLLRMWVSHDDCILRGTYIKSYLWFSHPKYVNLAIYGLCFSQKSLTLNIDGSYKISCFNWYLLVCDTCCFSQCISTIICVPLMIFVMSLMSWEFVYIIWDKMELYALFFRLLFGYHVLPFSNYFMCTCFFLDVYLTIVIYLETYTHEKCYISIWYPISFLSTSFMLFDLLVAMENICLMSACQFISFCALIFIWNLFALCVFKWHSLILAYHSFETMVILNAHPWCTLLKGFGMSHTHHLVETKDSYCFSNGFFYRSLIWYSTICLLQVLWLLLYPLYLA